MVLQFGIAPDYVLDSMRVYEMEALMKHADFACREAWEQTRAVVYAVAQGNSTRRLKATDVLPLPWDKKKSAAPEKVSKRDKERLEAKAQEYLKRQ